MTFLNFVMNVIAIFFMSFIKIQIKVWKIIFKLLRRFLWGKIVSNDNIHRVRWVDVCKPKKNVDLGVHDLNLVNLALLGI